jgi:NitT/TauT family transport system substrate-binding protein
MLADADASIKALNARDPLTQYKIEMERLNLLRPAIETARTKASGFGAIDKATLERQIEYVGAAVQFKSKPEADALFNASFLPPQTERMPLK